MSTTPDNLEPNEELHFKIMEAFHNYFQAHRKWIESQTRESGLETRMYLWDIMESTIELSQLTYDQMKVIQDWRHERFAARYVSKRARLFLTDRQMRIAKGQKVPEQKIGRPKKNAK